MPQNFNATRLVHLDLSWSSLHHLWNETKVETSSCFEGKYHLIILADCEWKKQLDDGVFDDQAHILYGLIHSNGFGHLISINGIEGGLKYLCGRDGSLGSYFELGKSLLKMYPGSI